MARLLLFSIFIISTCGLIYELIAGTLASYLLGDSIMQFSTIIGVYLFSMGVGSYLSKFVDKKLITLFIQIELIIGLLGGFSALALLLSFQYLAYFKVVLYLLVFLIGTCVGLEIPLMMRILKTYYGDFKELVSQVFTFDYVGALLASVLFPLVLVPHLGLIQSSLLFGILNASVGFVAVYAFKDKLVYYRFWYGKAAFCLALLLIGIVFSTKIASIAEAHAYDGNVILSKSTPYQKIVLSRYGKDLRLFLNGNLQFSAQDEYRYHEALVHVGLSQINEPKRVLVLGGGDGLALREILKYPSVEHITLVDLDPAMTKLFKSLPMLTALNHESLFSPKVQIKNDDAFLWLKQNKQVYDFIIVDFPDPTNFSLGKLYTKTFYQYVYHALAPHGMAVVQSTSPIVARKSFWCIAHTLESAQFYVRPYFSYVPAFGYWGFHLVAKSNNFDNAYQLPIALRYLSADIIPSLFVVQEDMREVPTEINALMNQALVRYFEEEWQSYVL
jgi:spermidine synthase